MRTYNKLVRDNIPEIIRREGKIPKTYRLSIKEYRHALGKKLVEKSKEVMEADRREDLIKEMVDIEEVLLALMDTYKISCSEVTKIRNKRKKERGTFLQRIFLESVR